MKKFLRKYIIFCIICITIVAIVLLNINANYIISKVNNNNKTQSTNTRGTIINAPIDSRPVSRSNFSYLVGAAGYDYKEISDGLDYMGTDGTTYYGGNPSTVRSELSSTVSNYNNADTTVIVNASSYFFGGLVEVNNYEKYNNIDVSAISSLISNNINPTYYVVINLPRTLPDFRVIPLPSGISSEYSQVSGLQDYYASTTSPATSTSFYEATAEWGYFHYYNKIKAKQNNTTELEIFKQLPEYVQEFCKKFYNKYPTFLDNYGGMYENFLTFLNQTNSQLSSISNAKYQILVTTSDMILPWFISQHVGEAGSSNFNYIESEDGVTPKKYSGNYYDLININGNSNYCIINGGDETNHLILAKELVGKTNNAVNFNYIAPTDNSSISSSTLSQIKGDYDSINLWNCLNERENFINSKSSGYSKTTIDTYLQINNSTLNSSQVYYSAKNINENKNEKIVIGISGINSNGNNITGFDDNLFQGLCKDYNIFNLPYCSSWNTLGNSTGIALASAAVYNTLEKDLSSSQNDISSVQSRLTNYTNYKLISVLEGIVYNNNKGSLSENDVQLAERIRYSSTDSSKSMDLLNELVKGKYKTGNYGYTFENAGISAQRPWHRLFEVKINPELSTINLANSDTTTPIVEIAQTPKNYTIENVTLTITATDNESGLPETPYSFDGGSTWQATNSKEYSENTNNIIIEVRDASGNIFINNPINIQNIDRIPPTDNMPTIESKNETSATIKCNQSDNESGLNTIAFLIKEEGQSYNTINETTDTHKFENLKSNTKYTVKTLVSDKAGNITTSKENTFTTSAPTATSVNYTTEYWLQNVNDDNYTMKDSITGTGKAGESVTPTVKAYTGFIPPTAQTVTISADGTTKIVYKYTRNKHTVTVNKGEGIKSVTGAGTYKYEQKVTLSAEVEDGYSGLTWTGDTTTGIIDSMPDKDVVANVTSKKQETPVTSYDYKVKYDVNSPANTTATGIMADSQFKANIDNELTKNEYAIDGYTFKWWNTKADGTGTTYTNEEKINYNPTQNNETITLYAQWKKTDDKTLETSIKYSSTNPTNKDVVVTINSLNELKPIDGWTLSEDKKTITKTYTENKTETVKVIDVNNQEKDVEIKVNNIDKIKPEIKISYKENSDGTITVTITSNEKIEPIEGWTLSSDGCILTKTYTKGTSDSISIKDAAGNIITENIVATSNNNTNSNNTQQSTTNNNTTTEENINSKKDDTTASTVIPKTGEKIFIVILIVVTGILATLSYNRYKRIMK